MNIYIRIAFFLVILAWCMGIFAEFIIPLKSGFSVVLPFLHVAYSLVCHQNSEKELSDGILHTLVCSRCCGIYIGAFACSFITLFRKKLPPVWFPFIIIPVLIDIVLYNIGVYHYSKNAAFFTGFLSGSAGFLYILGAFQNFINENKMKKDL